MAAEGVAGRAAGIQARFTTTSLRRLPDAVAVIGIAVWAWLLEGRKFWGHNYVSIGWGDWVAHAYRASFLDHNGLANWDPDWDNGLPIFQGYQTMPHLLTVIVSHMFSTSIPHAMMLWTAALLLLLPVSGYLCLRGLGLGPAGAVLGGALLLDNGDIGPPIEDFSYLFGLALVPIMVWIVVRLLDTRMGYLGAVAIGITPYLHPYGTTAAAAAFAARLLYDRRAFLTRRVGLQSLVILLVSSFYWLPYIISARPKFEDPWNSSLAFERQLLAQTAFYGISFAALVLGLLAVAVVVASRRFPQLQRLVVITFIAAVLLGFIAGGSYLGLFPAAIVQIHFVRLLPVVGVMMAMVAAPLGDLLWNGIQRLRDPAAAAKVPVVGRRLASTTARPGHGLAIRVIGVGVVLGLLAPILAEGRHWFHAGAVPIADSFDGGRDLVQWANEHPELPRPMVIWTNGDDIAYSSFAAFGQYHFPGDYIVTRQWTVATPVLNDIMQTDRPDSASSTGNFVQGERLLRLYGVQYVFLSDYIPANVAFVSGKLKGHLTLVERLQDGWMAEVPWTPVTAFVAPLDQVRQTTLPDLKFLTYDEQALRDQKTQSYVDLAYSSTSTPASMTWNSPTDLTIRATASSGGALVIPQNWDTDWSATVNGQSLSVERVGPNFVGIQLGTLSGPVTVHLVHTTYRTWELSAILIVIGLIMAVALTVITRDRIATAKSTA